ncbi:MAG TPA: NAD-dependent epimerase/dehydratase family protein [Acidobacteriota bacterium]
MSDDFSNRTCLVTGAAGFIGSHLAQGLLDLGCRVVGVDGLTDYYSSDLKLANLNLLRARQGWTFHQGRLEHLELERLADGIDIVFHLAAQAGVRSSWGADFGSYLSCNLLATQRLLEVFRRRPLQSFVYASSSSVYGRQPDGPMREDAALFPVSPYGVTKAATEQLARSYWTAFGIPVVGLRYFTVYGPRQRPDMAFHKLLHAVAEAEEFPLYGDGMQQRDFTYISDAIAGTVAAARRGRPGEVYNIGGGTAVTLAQVLELIAQLAGRTVRVRREAAAPGEMRRTLADVGKARRELGYAPATALRDGLAAQWHWICEGVTAAAEAS